MIPADLFFHFPQEEMTQRQAQETDVQCFLGSLQRGGHIYQQPLLAWLGDSLRATVYLSHPEALEPGHSRNSPFIQSNWERVAQHAARLEVKHLGKAAEQSDPAGHGATCLYLYARWDWQGSPLLRGDTNRAVPLFLLPLGESLRDQIYRWAQDYQHLDHLALSAGALEIPAYRQMAEHTSDLSQTGRALCQDIENHTGKPTYYYLHRYWDHAEPPAVRRCPSCAHPWQDTRPLFQVAGLPFRCDACRLISEPGSTDDEPEYAKIGK
ncbi:MAG: DUF2310 family Zn-ribbon-containing protein [Candidatus Sericytochromatia bacterium]